MNYNILAKFARMFKDTDIALLRTLIGSSDGVLIATHTHPDGDALGSSAALCLQLRSKGIRAVVAYPEPLPPTISFILDGLDHIVGAEGLEKAMATCDTLICTDMNGLDRAGAFEDALRSFSGRRILIDHHLNPHLEEFDLVISTPEVSSASELEYWILKALYGTELDFRALYCLMTGMTTDTNNFANSVFPTTLQMAGELLAAGVDRDDIINRIYHSYRRNRVYAMSDILSGMKMLPGGVAYMIVSSEDWLRHGLAEGELEGLVNVPLSIGEVRLSIYLRQEGDVLRASLRSKKGVSARDIAAELFHGGGHENASGGRLVIGEDIESVADAARYIEEKVKI